MAKLTRRERRQARKFEKILTAKLRREELREAFFALEERPFVGITMAFVEDLDKNGDEVTTNTGIG